MAEPWTIARILDWVRKDFAGKGLPSPRLDAELILAHTLGLTRVDLYVRFEQPLQQSELASVRALVERRRKGEPVAYLLGKREFYGRTFAVDARVLVPRPETEVLVGVVLELLPKPGAAATETDAAVAADGPTGEPAERRVLDVCTGSGAIAVTLAAERADLRVDATELSEGAAEVARGNASKHGVGDRVRVLLGDLFGPVEKGRRYDVIASNPPYIPSADVAGLMADVRDFEPHLALDGGDDGLVLVRRLLNEAPEYLLAGGALVLEIGHDQGRRVAELARAQGYEEVALKEDYSGIERVVLARVKR